MFKGSNELRICGATLNEAIQYWLDNKVFNTNEPSPIVESCKHISNENGIAIQLKANAEPSVGGDKDE